VRALPQARGAGNDVRCMVTHARRPNPPGGGHMQCDTSLVSCLIGSSRPRACLTGPSAVASGRRPMEGEIVVRSHVTGSRGRMRYTFIYGIWV